MGDLAADVTHETPGGGDEVAPPNERLRAPPPERGPPGVESPDMPPCGDGTRARTSAIARRRHEVFTRGIDDGLQGRGGDPFGGIFSTGLRVPAFVNSPATRYLFQLGSFTVPEGQRARIVGFRQGWTLGLRQSIDRVIEQWVTDPFFRLADGNISWHLRKMPIGYPSNPRPGVFAPALGFPAPLQNFQFQVSDGSALLYQAASFGAPTGFYTSLTGYTPPNRGMPWGEPITGQLGNFSDLKMDWRDGNAWSSLDVPVEGPSHVAFYASVLQSNPATRPVVVPPVLPAIFYQNGLSAEEQFLLNFPTANIWRVAGAIAYEMEDYKR